MKVSLFTLVLLLASLSFLAGCRKSIPENAPDNLLQAKAVSGRSLHERPLKAIMEVYSTYDPDFAKGGCYCSPYLPGYMTGIGEGTSTLLGRFSSYSNWYAYYNAAGAQVTYSVPLPAEYYDRLKAYFTEEEVKAVRDLKVEVIFFDRQGNSIWSDVASMDMIMSPLNALHFSLGGSGVIVGGTGKFAGATGSYSFTGYADVFRSSAPGVPYLYSWFDIDGTIAY